MKKRKNIALFIAMLENGFSYSVCEGALMGAKDTDSNLFVFPVGIINANFDDVDANCYRYQYNTLCSCVDTKSFDAIIIEYGTVTSFLSHEEKLKLLKQFGDVPVILLAGEEDGYSSVCVDNRSGLREVIENLIEKRECSKIGFVSGPMTSSDGVERLEVYKETMKAHNLPCDESYIAYGNFSEFSEEIVDELLNRHPELEAIVCANDQMANGCYKTLEKRNLVPGKDIYVTGFDDSDVAMVMEPHLTSVKAEIKELAYLAVASCDELIGGKVFHKHVDSRMIERESSGGQDYVIIDSDVENDITIDESFLDSYVQDVFDNHFNNYYENSETVAVKKIMREYFSYFIHLVDEEGNLHLNKEEFLNRYLEFSVAYEKGFVDLDYFLSIIYSLYGMIGDRIRNSEDAILIMRAMAEVVQIFMGNVAKNTMVQDERRKLFEISLTNVTRDMLQYSRAEEKKYNSVIVKLKQMGFKSGYIVTYDKEICHEKDSEWVQPATVYAKAYYADNDTCLFSGKEKMIRTKSLFVSNIMPKNRRVDMLVMPLFSGVHQFGLMVTESSLDEFRYSSQIACQVSVSMEVLDIMKKQNEIKQKLEENLATVAENNRVLNAMSCSDALTGIANRRGFELAVGNILSNRNNIGKRAVAVFADMDNLKIVNDVFGHDEGDFAIKTIANALTESFRSSDVVARLGGDEFVAFAIANTEHFSDTLRKRIQSILMEKNINDKPYYVNISIGTYEFTIEENLDLDDILGKADEALYQEKKNKVKVVYKEPRE